MENQDRDVFNTGFLDPDVTSGVVAFNATVTNSPSGTWLSVPEGDVAEISRLAAVTLAIKRHYLWVIFAFGFPGNVASLVVILRLRCFGSPALYVATLAVTDSLALVVKLLVLQLHVHKAEIGMAACKLLLFLGNHLVVYANWVLVTMAVERFVAVWEPLRISRMWTSSRAAVSLVVVCVLAAALTAPLLVMVTYNPAQKACAVYDEYMPVLKRWQWVQTAAYGFIPCAALITLNLFISLLIGRARRLQRSLTPPVRQHGQGGPHNSAAGLQRQATILLSVASAALVLTTTPVCVYLLAQQWWQPPEGSVEFERKQLVRNVVYAVCDANHSVNFYLYFISARKFRSHFYKMLSCVCSRTADGTGRSDRPRVMRIFSSGKFKAKAKTNDHVLLAGRHCSPEGHEKVKVNKGGELELKLNQQTGTVLTSTMPCQ